MPFLAPLALLSALVIGPIIIAMYLLKLRRDDRAVSSTFLWRQVVRDVEANAPWQRLRPSWLLLLQLLLLLLLAFALARPFLLTNGISGRNLIMIIDRSASMTATDVPGSRLSAAKAQARQLADQLPDGGRATVIAAGGQMEVLAASTTDRRQIYQAIDAIQPRNGGGSDLSQALTLAAALAARESESEVAIISDGNVSVPPDLRMPATVRFFPIGSGAQNQAISAMALQPSPNGQLLFVQVANYGSSPAKRRLDLYLDGQLANAYELEIAADGERSVTADVPATVRVAEARLAASPDDALAADDRGWAVGAPEQPTTVRLIGENRFIETALGLLPSIALTKSAEATAPISATAQPAVTIFDRTVPTTLPPGNLLFIGPPRATELFSVTGEVDFPTLRPVAADALGPQTILKDISLSDVSVLKASRVVPGSWARVLVESDGGPMLLAGERDGRRIVVLAFALQNSDLPLQVAYPLLMSNIISYLAPGAGADTAQLAPGQPLQIPADAQTSAVRVTLPDGSVRTLTPRGGSALFAETDALGPYVIEQLRGTAVTDRRRYTVDLFSPAESRIGPQRELAIAQASGLTQAVTSEQVGKEEIWRWLAALALLILIVEWLVYQRPALVYLRDRLRRS